MNEPASLLKDSDYKLRIDSLLKKLFGDLEKLRGEDCDRGGSVPDLLVLGLGSLDENSGGRMADVQQREYRCSVIGDSVASVALDHLVHSARPQCGLDYVRDCLAGIDIAYDLVDSLGVVGSFP